MDHRISGVLYVPETGNMEGVVYLVSRPRHLGEMQDVRSPPDWDQLGVQIHPLHTGDASPMRARCLILDTLMT